MRKPLIALVLPLIVVVACAVRARDDDDDNGSSTVSTTASTGSGTKPTPATVADACAGIASRWQQCDGDPDFDQARCIAAEACFRLTARDAAEQPLLDCYAAWSTAPDCNGPYCSEKLTPLELTADHVAHLQRCDEFDAVCGSSAGDICRNPTWHLEGQLLAQMAPCFDLGCGQEFDSCLQDVSSQFLSQCGGSTGSLI